MANSAEAKKKAVARLRRIQGQAQALERAVNEGVESSKLLQQVSAMRGATDGLMPSCWTTTCAKPWARAPSKPLRWSRSSAWFALT